MKEYIGRFLFYFIKKLGLDKVEIILQVNNTIIKKEIFKYDALPQIDSTIKIEINNIEKQFIVKELIFSKNSDTILKLEEKRNAPSISIEPVFDYKKRHINIRKIYKYLIFAKFKFKTLSHDSESFYMRRNFRFDGKTHLSLRISSHIRTINSSHKWIIYDDVQILFNKNYMNKIEISVKEELYNNKERLCNEHLSINFVKSIFKLFKIDNRYKFQKVYTCKLKLSELDKLICK